MLPRLARVKVVDASGAGWLQTFHVYRGSFHRAASLGDFIKGSVTHVAFYPRYRRGKRYRPLRVGHIVRALVVQTRHPVRFADDTRATFLANAGVLLRSRGNLRTKLNPHLLCRAVRRRRYEAVFAAFV